MKTTRILSAAFIAAALVGCSQEEQFNMNQDGQMQFVGSFEQVASRVTMDENYNLNWEQGTDKVSIFPGITVNNQYQVSSVTNGTASFSFVDYVEAESYGKLNPLFNYGLYPYDGANKIVADGTMTASVPAEITDYDGMANSIKTALMAAKSANGSLSFKNVQGILRLKLNAVQPFLYGPVQSIQLESASQNLSGKVNITFNAEGLPEAEWVEGGKVLTLGLSDAYKKDLASLGSYSEFYLPMVPAEFAANDVKLTINFANNSYEVKVPINFNIERRKIYTLAHTLKGGTNFEGDLEGDIENPIFVATIAELQNAIDNATGNVEINVAADITGDAVVPQKEGVNITILGQGFKFNGMITVDGKSEAHPTAGLTIKDLNFAAEAISGDACVRLGDGSDATRYTSNVTVENCTFDVPGAVGVKSYTGGDKNLTIKDCTATDKAHSLVQVANIEGEGILVEGCTINSKNGMNFNSTAKVTIDNCTANVRGYAARFGQGGSSANGDAEAYSIKNSTLKSACEEAGDAVIVLRGSADNATLTIESTTIEGTPGIANNAVGAKVIIDGENAITSLAELQALIDNGETEITLDTDIMGTVVMKSGVTINGDGNLLGSVNLNGADNVTLQNIVFDAANAVYGYDGGGTKKDFAFSNIITGDNVNKPNKGAHNLVIDGCTFTGTFANPGAAIAFTDQTRSGGGSGNITIKNCVFDNTNANYVIYAHYTGDSMNGHGNFVIEGNTFMTVCFAGPIYLGRYASDIPVVLTGNTFTTVSSQDAAIYVQDHGSYGVSINASNNTFN